MTEVPEKKRITSRVSKVNLECFKEFVTTNEAKDLIKDQAKNKHVSILKKAFEDKIGCPISKSTVYKILYKKESKQ